MDTWVLKSPLLLSLRFCLQNIFDNENNVLMTSLRIVVHTHGVSSDATF